MAAMSCRGLSIHSLRHLLPEADFVWSNSPKTLKPSLLLPWRHRQRVEEGRVCVTKQPA